MPRPVHRKLASPAFACVLALASLPFAACKFDFSEPLRLYGKSESEKKAEAAAQQKAKDETKAPVLSPTGSLPASPPDGKKGTQDPDAKQGCEFKPLVRPSLSRLTEYVKLRGEIEIEASAIAEDGAELVTQIVAYAGGLPGLTPPTAAPFVESIMKLSQSSPEPKERAVPAASKAPPPPPYLASARAFVVHRAAMKYATQEKDGDGDGRVLPPNEAKAFADAIHLKPDADKLLATHQAAFRFAVADAKSLGLGLKPNEAWKIADALIALPNSAEILVAYRDAYRLARSEKGFRMDEAAAREYARKQSCLPE